VTWAPAVAPSVVVLYPGYNDTAASGATFRTNYTALIDAVRVIAPNSYIFAVNPVPYTIASGNSRTSDLTTVAATRIKVYVLDAAENSGITSTDLQDGIHETPGGQIRLAQYLSSAILNEFATQKVKIQSRIGAGGFIQ
jgi:hypothetical protein